MSQLWMLFALALQNNGASLLGKHSKTEIKTKIAFIRFKYDDVILDFKNDTRITRKSSFSSAAIDRRYQFGLSWLTKWTRLSGLVLWSPSRPLLLYRFHRKGTRFRGMMDTMNFHVQSVLVSGIVRGKFSILTSFHE